MPAICGLCPHGCWVRVRVEDGTICTVAADPDPRYGNLCERGRLAPEIVYSPDRIRTPLLRTGPRGTVSFRPATWDEALDRIAGKFLRISDAHGARAVASYFGAGTLEDSLLENFDRVLAPFGSPNDMNCGSICYVSSMILAPITTLGIPGASLGLDFENAEIILLWGTNPLKDGLPDKMRRIRAARKRGARLIVVDPRRHRLAREADEWVPVLPGTDGALALSLIHVIIREGWYDREFVEGWTEGFSALAAYAQGFAPQVAQTLCGVEAQVIEDLAATLGRARGVALDFYSGLEYAPSGTQNSRALYALLAITGNVDAEGGLLIRDCPHEPPPEFSLPQDRPPLGAREYPLFFALTGRAHLAGLPAAVLDSYPYPVRALLLVGGSPYLSYPDPDIWKRVYESLDFLVVVDRFLPEEAAWADVILPVTTCYEISSFQRYRECVRLRERVIEPVGESRNDTLILAAIMKRLGCGGLPCTEEEILAQSLTGEGGLLEQIREGAAVVEALQQKTIHHKYRTGLLRKDGKPGFPTPTGKFEFSSTLLSRYGYDSLPIYDPPRAPEGLMEEPLLLTTGARSRRRFNSQYLDRPELVALHGPALEIHPIDAAARGIRNGDRVSVSTGSGQLHLEAHVTPHIYPGAVHAPHGGGSRHHLGAWRHANINAIIPPVIKDPISGYPAVKAVPCEVMRISSHQEAMAPGWDAESVPLNNELILQP